MSNRGCLAGLSAAGIVAVASSPALAGFTVSSSAFALGELGSSHSGTGPALSYFDDSENEIGGHGYSQVFMDFMGGKMTARNHACVGPAFQVSDEAAGNGRTSAADEVFTIVNDGLPAGTMVDVVLCLSFTSEVIGDVRDGAGGNNFSRNIFSARVDSQTIVTGSHTAQSNWQDTSGTGHFAGATESIATYETTFAFSLREGRTFRFSISGITTSQASDFNADPFSFPLATGSAGYAITFGLSAITEGAHLEWNGQTWTGSCESSALLVPPNPITPAAPTLGVGGIGLLLAGRRRR